MTKHRSRDKESVAKSHRNAIIETRSLKVENKIVETKIVERMEEALDTSKGSSRRELSTLAPCEAKPPEILDSCGLLVVIR